MSLLRRSRDRVSLTAYLGRQSNVYLVGVGVLSALIIGLYDCVTRFEIGFSVFYVVPIVIVTWYVNTWIGAALALFCAAIWYAGVLLVGTGSPYGPWVPVGSAVVRLAAFLILVAFLAKLKGAFDIQKILSRTDHLTGVMNRGTFTNLAALEIERMRRNGRPFTVGYIDVDNFKLVNDRFGHKKGDALLVMAARTIGHNTRHMDVLARLGGDEFVLMLPETGAASGAVLFHRLKGKLTQAMQQNQWPATFSFGVVTFLKAPASVDEMIARTDRLMYEAKQAGKNIIKQEIFDTQA